MGEESREPASPQQWDVIRRAVYARAGRHCEVCGGETDKLVCHEVWCYDDARHVARLVGLQAICRACNLATHFGRARNIGMDEEALDHLMDVNRWTREEAATYVAQAFEQWAERSEHLWQLDTSELTQLLSGVL